ALVQVLRGLTELRSGGLLVALGDDRLARAGIGARRAVAQGAAAARRERPPRPVVTDEDPFLRVALACVRTFRRARVSQGSAPSFADGTGIAAAADGHGAARAAVPSRVDARVGSVGLAARVSSARALAGAAAAARHAALAAAARRAAPSTRTG